MLRDLHERLSAGVSKAHAKNGRGPRGGAHTFAPGRCLLLRGKRNGLMSDGVGVGRAGS